jgi:hypothetical protein
MAPKSRTGGAAPKTLDIRLAQAGHDARIAEALKVFLDRPSAPKLVGIMGGHGLPRSTTGAYARRCDVRSKTASVDPETLDQSRCLETNRGDYLTL